MNLIKWEDIEDPLDDYNLSKRSDANEVNRTLAKKQRKSSAVETLFTMTLLTFSWAQLTGGSFVFGGSSLQIQTSFNWPIHLMYILTMALALVIGGESLWIEMKLSAKRIRNKF